MGQSEPLMLNINKHNKKLLAHQLYREGKCAEISQGDLKLQYEDGM